MAEERGSRNLVARVLGNPSDYPDEFKSFLSRYVPGNPNIRIEDFQLPVLEQTHYVGTTGNPAFLDTWVNYASGNEAAGFYKDAIGRVMLCGLIKNGTLGSTIFTLPASYRPKLREVFIVITGAADQIGRVDVAADGSVIHVSGAVGYVQLSGISFRAY